MNRSWLVPVFVGALWLGACSRETPTAPPPTAIVVPASPASAPFPTAPASDPSLPPASVVEKGSSQGTSTAAASVQAGSAASAAAVDSAGSAAMAMPAASAASQP
jgi:hypothetical protein